MRIAKVIGSVTLVRSHPALRGASYRLAVPMTLAEISADAEPSAEPLVVYDDLGSSVGDKIAVSESREAAMPFHPEVKPIDAYCAALLDEIYVD